MEPVTPIFLTEDQAKQFVSFQKHYALIGFLENIKAFDIKSGSITIHFDGVGRISAVKKEENYKI